MNKIFNLILIISALTVLLWLVSVSNRAIDFIDEGYYLNWISNPYTYTYGVTLFGFIYHPIYLFLNENLVLLRQWNIIFTYTLSLLLVWVVLTPRNKNETPIKRLTFLSKLALSTVISLTSLFTLIRLNYWLPTPSYNTLAFQGSIVFLIGLLQEHQHREKNNFLAYSLIGVGGWITFMAKPNSAALMAITWVIYSFFIYKRRLWLKSLLAPGITALCLLLITALHIDGSIMSFVTRLLDGVESIRLFAEHTTSALSMFRIDTFGATASEALVLVCTTIISFVVLVLSNRLKNSSQVAFEILIFLITLSCAVAVVRNDKLLPDTFIFNNYVYITFFVISGLLIYATLNKLKTDRKSEINKSEFSIAIILFITPYIITFGSGNNYWGVIGSMTFFSIIAIFFLSRNAIVFGNIKLTPFLALGQLSIAIIFTVSHLFPYNKAFPLSQIDTQVTLPSTGVKMLVTQHVENFISSLSQQANLLEFKKGMSIIDLSGHYGLSTYLLGGKSVGMPYFFGGYPGSEKRAVYALRHASCEEIARSWLLIEENGYRQLPKNMLKQFGVDAQTDFIESKHFSSIHNLNNKKWEGKTNNQYWLKLLKPKRKASIATNACLNAVRNSSS